MAYSCTDFTDDILDALGIELKPENYDHPNVQADLCIDEILRLQRVESAVCDALAAHYANPNAPLLIDRLQTLFTGDKGNE